MVKAQRPSRSLNSRHAHMVLDMRHERNVHPNTLLGEKMPRVAQLSQRKLTNLRYC